MHIQGIPIGLINTPCPYREGLTFESETVVIREIDAEGLEFLLSIGFRHFGDHFFRPQCADCHQCIPIRIPVQEFSFGRNFRKLLRKNRHLHVEIAALEPSMEKYELYLSHSGRFEENGTPQYEDFIHSFFEHAPYGQELRIYEGDELLAVSHMDLTDELLSAIYCYWNPKYARFGLGNYAVLRQIALAKQRGCRYVYLGYYVHDNNHMNYKSRFGPLEALLTEYNWVPLIDKNEPGVRTEVVEHGFIARMRLASEAPPDG